ncbi:MAG: 2OG-Fe(II) oxygenase [Halioglobus sp.]
MKSKDFIQYLEEVSGIRSLIHDPEYHGAGTHNNFDGQGMLTHIDFNHHPSTGYHRRLNLIIYLNDEWDESWGGHLELHKDPWDPENDWHVSYPPIINNAVLFETNEVSWHGFNIIRLPEGKKNLSRKSLTVYYYTKERPENEVAPKHSSIFAPRLMPPSIKPGELITNEQFLELEDMLTRNVKHIRGIYGFRENLLMQIEGYKRKIRQYESHLVLRTVGQAIQVGGAKGISADGKLLDTLQAVFRPLGSVSAIKIHLRVPEFIGANAFDVSVNGESFALHADEPGVHAILCCLHAECTKEITISVACGRLISPNEVNGSPDKQCFGAIINYVEFIP